ncbi:Serine carboxypeptidase-like 49 [Glycine max]|nr:Serine carboxypeptidase-like 49 [Glycine max]
MASSPTFSKVSLLLLVSLSFSYATSGFNHEHAYPPQSQAEMLTRNLNLFPKDPVNIIKGDFDSFVPGKIVEKKFSLLGHSGPSIQHLGHHAGHYSLPHSKAARMFYFFFESRNNKDDPVVIWLTGGPGCGSELALFYENGPFHIANNLSLTWNDYGWDQASNILFVDQPTGTGFSYSSDDSDIRHDEASISNDLYDFLQEFFKAHPKFVKNDFYITGESYAGHYIPALASRIIQGNKENQGIYINLKGLAIGNGATNPAIQYQAYPDFALDNKIITKANYDEINKLIPDCEQAAKTCETQGGQSCAIAFNTCQKIFYHILDFAPGINYYDIRKKCKGDWCYDFRNVETLLNLPKVKSVIGVSNDLQYVSCSKRVHEAMMQDYMRNMEVEIPSLLEDGIKLLVYVGEEDLICNWLGNSRWVHAMKWSGKKAFGKSPTVKFVVDGSKAGSLNSYGPLSFLKVHEAGHLVPMDQPKAALQMLQISSSYATSRFTHKRDYPTQSQAEKLIRSLNLLPKDSVNIVKGDHVGFVPGKIVEKKFSLFCDSGPSIEDLGHHAGYYSLPHSKAARMFYFFFESRNNKDDPVVIWLTGGPGCGSELALFYENGPFHIANNLSLTWNDYGWDQASNILFVDQPTGTGFSYSSEESDIRHDETGISNDLYDFLQEFFKAHPEFVKNDFYITGESYAGHYVPALASRGFAIGNGLTNPAIQYQAYPDFALDNGIITNAEYDNISKLIPGCEQAAKTCVLDKNGEVQFTNCTVLIHKVQYYDIRKKCVGELCYDFGNVEEFLNQKKVKSALGVRDDLQYVLCSTTVHAAMLQDWMRNMEVGIPSLLEDGIKLLVYAGEEDLICNWLGNSRWAHAMEWSGQKAFGTSSTVKFVVDGVEAGSLNSYGPLSFLKVHGAGHMVPMDQPKVALQMLKSWMGGKLNASFY